MADLAAATSTFNRRPDHPGRPSVAGPLNPVTASAAPRRWRRRRCARRFYEGVLGLKVVDSEGKEALAMLRSPPRL